MAVYNARQVGPYLLVALVASTSWSAIAQIRPAVKSTLELVNKYQPRAGGDTVHYGAFLPYDGKVCLQETGCILGEFNDGAWSGEPTHRLGIMAIDSVDMDSLEGTTLHQVNAMPSYTTAGCCGYPGEYQVYTAGMFVKNGNLYINNIVQNISNNYLAVHSGWSVSPDGGQHWCNYGTYQAGGLGGPNSCDTGNWRADGDVPKDVGSFQFPSQDSADYSSKMEYLTEIMVPCAGGMAANCTTPMPAALDPECRYFYGHPGTREASFLFRACGDPMLPSSWMSYNGGDWDPVLQNATPIVTKGVIGIADIMWLPHFRRYAYAAALNSKQVQICTSTVPWGPFRIEGSFQSTVTIQFPNLVPGTYRYVDGHVTVVMASNDPSGANLQLQLLDLGKAMPTFLDSIRPR
jgi:hypothetical protein